MKATIIVLALMPSLWWSSQTIFTLETFVEERSTWVKIATFNSFEACYKEFMHVIRIYERNHDQPPIMMCTWKRR